MEYVFRKPTGSYPRPLIQALHDDLANRGRHVIYSGGEFDDPAEAAWASARRTPHPVGCFTEPVRLARPLEDYPFTRTYIKATGEPRPESGGPFWAAAERAKASPAWRYREIATSHMVASNRPTELVGLLLELT